MLGLTSFGQNTVVKGRNASYAGQVLLLYTYSDFITNTLEIVTVDTVAADGSFQLSFQLGETKRVLIPIGIYKMTLFVEPGKTYDISFPDYKPKGYAELLNPYFLPTEVEVAIKGSDTSDINMLIHDFDLIYSNYVDENQERMLKFPRQTDVDTLIEQVEEIFAPFGKPYFIDYRKYKYAWLKFATYMRDNRYITREYFHDHPFLYQNEAYMDLFNQIYTNFLGFYANSKEGERLFSDIAYAKSPTYIYETFENNLVLKNDTLQELVLLKGIQDAMYSDEYPFKSLLITLDSVAYLTKVAEHKKIAQNIRKKAVKGRLGYPAPVFALYDSDSVLRKSEQYLSNYVYLNFCTIKSFACQKDFTVMKTIHDKHKEKIKIISIAVDNDFEATKRYFQQKGYGWILLDGSSCPGLLEAYNVSVFPTYFVIDKEGKFGMVPSPKPSENFEYRFFEYLQAKRK
jgi:hypothetical protein